MKSLLVLFAVLISSAAFAAEGSVEGSVESKSTDFTDNLYFSLFSNFHGPQVGSISSPYALTANGKAGTQIFNAINFDSELTAAYMVSPNVGIGAVVPFFLYPVMGEGFVLGDVGVKAFNKKIFTNHDMTIYANIILQLPSSDYSSAHHMKLGVKTTPSIRYNVPDSRFALGAWTEAKAYLGMDSGKTFKLYGAPYINYQLAPKFSLNLEFEMEANHIKGAPSMDLKMVQTDFMPGFVYMITPKVMINPYLQIFTTEKVALDRTGLGAIITASL